MTEFSGRGRLRFALCDPPAVARGRLRFALCALRFALCALRFAILRPSARGRLPVAVCPWPWPVARGRGPWPWPVARGRGPWP